MQAGDLAGDGDVARTLNLQVQGILPQIEQGDVAAALDLDRGGLGQREAHHRARLAKRNRLPGGLAVHDVAHHHRADRAVESHVAAAKADRYAFALDDQLVAFVLGPDRRHRVGTFTGYHECGRVRAPEHHIDRAPDDELADRLQGTVLLDGVLKAIPGSVFHWGGHVEAHRL